MTNDSPRTGTDAPESVGRPLAISVLCVIGFIAAELSFVWFFSSDAAADGTWYPPYLAISSVLSLACLIGVWQMKRIAAYSYAVLFITNQPIMWLLGGWHLVGFIIPGLFTAIALYYSNRMR